MKRLKINDDFSVIIPEESDEPEDVSYIFLDMRRYTQERVVYKFCRADIEDFARFVLANQ